MPATQGELRLLEVGGPYPSTSLIECVDSGWSSAPYPEPPEYEPIAMLDSRTEGEQNEMAQRDARLLAAAWNSYQRLAARTGADPVALAEADVLGKWHGKLCHIAGGLAMLKELHPNTSLVRAIADSVDEALAACRKEQT